MEKPTAKVLYLHGREKESAQNCIIYTTFYVRFFFVWFIFCSFYGNDRDFNMILYEERIIAKIYMTLSPKKNTHNWVTHTHTFEIGRRLIRVDTRRAQTINFIWVWNSAIAFLNTRTHILYPFYVCFAFWFACLSARLIRTLIDSVDLFEWFEMRFFIHIYL